MLNPLHRRRLIQEKTKLWVRGERMLALTPDEPPDTFNFLPELQQAKQSHLYEALKKI